MRKVSETSIGEATIRSFGSLQREYGCLRGSLGGTDRRKPDWPLHAEAVRRMLTVS